MAYNGNCGFYQRPFLNPPPSFHSPMPPHMNFNQRGPPPPMSRAVFHRRGGPTFRNGFGQGPPFPQQINRPPPYMINSPSFGSFPESEAEINYKTLYKAIDLSKPWVTEEMKFEFVQKEELFKKAKETQQQMDWAIFREQRNKCTKMYYYAEQYFNKNQDSENSNMRGNRNQQDRNNSNIACDNPNQVPIFACDSCDRTFPSESAFNKHMSEHRVCGIDGCTLSAHEKIIEKHIQMQHSTGIFEKMKDLNSPENIAKWIAERKSKFPSKTNIEERQKMQEELWKKGIRIGERKNKFGKDKTRFQRKDPETFRKERETFFKKKEEKKNRVIQRLQPKIKIDDKADWNNGLPPFKGTKNLFEDKQEDNFNISDDEDDCLRKPSQIKDVVKVNPSLAALMAYGSDCSEDDDVSEAKTDTGNKNKGSPKVNVVNLNGTPKNEEVTAGNSNGKNSDDEGPLEMKIEKTKAPTEIDQKEELPKKNRRRKGNKRKNEKVENKKGNNELPYEFKKRKISQLEVHLDEDIRRERNIILQCVRYTVQNDFFTK